MACNFIKKESLAQVISSEFREMSKNTCFTEHLRATASVSSVHFCGVKRVAQILSLILTSLTFKFYCNESTIYLPPLFLVYLCIDSYIFSTFVFLGDRFLSLVRSKCVECFEAAAIVTAIVL